LSHLRRPSLPLLPLLLWETPPGLELILRQEGVPFRRLSDPNPLSLRGGKFVLFDGRKVNASALFPQLAADQIAIDVDRFRQQFPSDPFTALVDNRGAIVRWDVGGLDLTERVSRHEKAGLRRALIARLREQIGAGGGVWARLSSFPFPYRSAFNFRVDLDETCVRDYARFARARRPLADCCTHFVSTSAYGQNASVLADLGQYDTQSHGHHHVIYRGPESNRRNLVRAHQALTAAGINPVGFAAPHGRWNPGLDSAVSDLAYTFSSEFQVGYDDLPFFPWLGDRFSNVLQVPIHPICEGLFFEAGEGDGDAVATHLVRTVRAKIDASEPAFVYGHPERRLARHPQILAALAEAVAGEALLWRVTLSEFARWWDWRGRRDWSLVPRPEGRLEVQFDEWKVDYAIALEVVRGSHVASIPLAGSRTPLRLEDLAYEWRPSRPPLPGRVLVRPPRSLKDVVRSAIDWETTTPLDDLPSDTLSERVKKGLRLLRDSRRVRTSHTSRDEVVT
jgi:hypothetical protein